MAYRQNPPELSKADCVTSVSTSVEFPWAREGTVVSMRMSTEDSYPLRRPVLEPSFTGIMTDCRPTVALRGSAQVVAIRVILDFRTPQDRSMDLRIWQSFMGHVTLIAFSARIGPTGGD